MSKNLIPEICKLLGVELGEEFKIKDDPDGFVSNETYKFSENALLYQNVSDYCLASDFTLRSLLTGDVEIIKLPWKPKAGEDYYSFCRFRGQWCVWQQQWSNHPVDLAMLTKGWVYRTREEAKAALPAVAEELGVEYEL